MKISRNLSVVRSNHLYLVRDRRETRSRHVPAGRTLHLIDLENLAGGPFETPAAIHDASVWYRNTAPVKSGDHVVVAVNPMLAFAADSEWPGTRLRVGRGPNGADRALINELQDARWIAAHFDRLLIGSGDGIFAPPIRAMLDRGIAVGVLAREHSVSRALRQSADFVMLLENLPFSQDVA